MGDVTVKLSLGTFSVEVTGPEDYANRKFEELVEKFLPTPFKAISSEFPILTPGPSVIDPVGKKLSPAEFLRKISHTNQLDRALALGYYLEKVGNNSSFTTKELLELSRQVKYPFANISESVSRLVGRGLMMTAGEKEGVRTYSLTATGEQTIESMADKS